MMKVKGSKSKTCQVQDSVARVRIKESHSGAGNKGCSEEDAYRFFCHTYDELERNTPPFSSKRETDVVINIEDESHIPLVPCELVNRIVNTDLLCVPCDSPVDLVKIIPGDLKPRFLEDEGLYVCERPEVSRTNYCKMANQLIKQDEGQRWFGEDGCMIALPDPLQKYWSSKIHFPFPSPSPCLTTACMKPGTVCAAESGVRHWQLDLNLAGLVFTHHPLYSREHVLAQRLLTLCEHHQSRERKGMTAFLEDKLRALKNSETNMITNSQTTVPKLKVLQRKIRDTQCKLEDEREADLSLVKNIVAAWKRIKALRAKKGYVSTTVKLKLQRTDATAEVSTEKTANDSTANRSRTDEHMRPVYMDGDITITRHYLCKELEEEETQSHSGELLEESDCVTSSVSQRRAERLALVPVLTMNGVVTATCSCPLKEKIRRHEVSNRKISVNIFYNGKLVSTSEPSTFDHDFRVNLQQVFNMQIVNSPESITLEVYELAKNKSTILAKVYVPIPDRNMLSSNAPIVGSEFSSDQVVQFEESEAVGSNTTFKMDEDEATNECLLTSGKLLYVVSWAVDDSGFPMAPTAPPLLTSFTSPTMAWPNQEESYLKWITGLQFDPNHPANTKLTQLLREAGEQGARAGLHFRLDSLSEEFNFATEERLQASRRFGLLQLRSSQAVDAPPSAPIPLHDRDITDAMMEDYTECPSPSPMDEDPIMAQRTRSIRSIQKVLNLARKNLRNIKKKYKLSDIVTEYHDANTAKEWNWDMFRRVRRLKPLRAEKRSIPLCVLSDGDLKIRVAVGSARNIPVRRQAFLKEMRTRGSCCTLSSNRHATFCNSERGFSQAQVQPFVEVRFQQATFETSVGQGRNPSWREEFTFDLKYDNRYDIIIHWVSSHCSIGGDYSHSRLSNVQDNIVINIFDEISFQVIESSSLRGCGTQIFSGRQWLGSVTVPFSTLLQQLKVNCTLSVNTPPALLGYTWSREDRFYYRDSLTEEDNTSYLEVFITLDPPVCLKEDPTVKDVQKPLWLFSTREDDRLLDLTHDFERHCKATCRGKRVVTMVMNSEGQLVLANRFFRPLPPPQDVMQGDADSGRSVLEKVAAFVSLIPILPVLSDVGDHGEMWFTSEQCLDLVIGNSVSLAVLLCNFFLYLNTKAWLALGASVLEGETAYVLTQEAIEGTGYVLWNPRDGKHFQQHDVFCPLKTVDCIVNGQNVWFHPVQTSVMPKTFDLASSETWTHLFSSGFTSSSMPIEIEYRPPRMELINQLQRRMEMRLKNSVMEWRSPHPTRWNPHCAAILAELLQRLELRPAPRDTEEEIHTLLSSMKDYKNVQFVRVNTDVVAKFGPAWKKAVTGMPIHLAYLDMNTVIEAVHNTRIHSTEIPGTEFALSVYIQAYPNEILSVWVFLATLVKHQQGVFYLPPTHDR